MDNPETMLTLDILDRGQINVREGRSGHRAQDRTKINKSITQDVKKYETMTPQKIEGNEGV